MKKILLLIITSFIIQSNLKSQWTQQGIDIDGEDIGDQFGYSVELSSDGLITAIGGINNQNGKGHVRIFKNIGGTWIQQGSDIDGESSNDFFGTAVSLSDNGMIVAIGASANDGNGTNSGHVRIFEYINGIWSQIGTDIVGESSGDNSGWSTSLSSDGSILAIGAPSNDGNGLDVGHVRVFKNIGGTWVQQGLDIDGENPNDFFGRSVKLSSNGSILAIGAPGNDDNGRSSGHVRVYKNISGTWTQQGTDINGEGDWDDSGEKISLSSNGLTVAIGAKGNDDNGSNSGHVRIYKFINGTWIQQGTDIDGESASDSFGYSVSLSSNGLKLAVGANKNSQNGTNSGHVRVYEFIGGTWIQQGVDIEGEAVDDYFGTSVKLSSNGSVLAIGAPFNDGVNGLSSGHVRIFSSGVASVISSLDLNKFSIYPNPSNTDITLEMEKIYSNFSISITDITGKIIFSLENVSNNKIILPTASLRKGSYFVKVKSNKSFKTLPIVKN